MFDFHMVLADQMHIIFEQASFSIKIIILQIFKTLYTKVPHKQVLNYLTLNFNF